MRVALSILQGLKLVDIACLMKTVSGEFLQHQNRKALGHELHMFC